MIAWARRTVNDSELTKRDRQPATALTVIMALHHRSIGPQAKQACSGRGHPVNDSAVTERHRQPVTALTVVMARHHRSVEPQARQACYGRDHPVNSADPCNPCSPAASNRATMVSASARLAAIGFSHTTCAP